MRLVLRKSVEKLGKIGDIVEVADGYGRNYLLPRGLAMHVSQANVARVEAERKVEEKRQEELRARTTELAGRMDGLSLTITAKASEEGHLYGSVGPQMVADALKAEGFDIEPRAISLAEAIKELGVYEVKINLGPDVEPVCKLWVVAE